MMVPPNVPVIWWCSLCNAKPATGMLEIIRKGELLTEQVKACDDCVNNLSEDQWLH